MIFKINIFHLTFQRRCPSSDWLLEPTIAYYNPRAIGTHDNEAQQISECFAELHEHSMNISAAKLCSAPSCLVYNNKDNINLRL